MIDADKLRALDEAAEREEDDARYYGGPTPKHRPHGSALLAYLRNSIPAILSMEAENKRLREALVKCADSPLSGWTIAQAIARQAIASDKGDG